MPHSGSHSGRLRTFRTCVAFPVICRSFHQSHFVLSQVIARCTVALALDVALACVPWHLASGGAGALQKRVCGSGPQSCLSFRFLGPDGAVTFAIAFLKGVTSPVIPRRCHYPLLVQLFVRGRTLIKPSPTTFTDEHPPNEKPQKPGTYALSPVGATTRCLRRPAKCSFFMAAAGGSLQQQNSTGAHSQFWRKALAGSGSGRFRRSESIHEPEHPSTDPTRKRHRPDGAPMDVGRARLGSGNPGTTATGSRSLRRSGDWTTENRQDI